MNIRELAVSRLHEYENNPRNNDLAVEKVKYSIERFGFLFPVVVDMNYTIVCGHTRVRACRELGIMSVPCIIADELTEEQINLFRLVDNKTSEYSDWDFEKLKDELSQVDLTLEKNQLLLERFELSAEVFDIEPEQAEIRVPAFNFMGVNKPEPPKTVNTSTNEAESSVSDEPVTAATESCTESTYIAEDVISDEVAKYDSNDEAYDAQENQSQPSVANTTDIVDGGAQPEPAKVSKATVPFCQFRFGDVAFFISQVELDRMNAKYAEYIDSGEVLKQSFASYLLKGVEMSD